MLPVLEKVIAQLYAKKSIMVSELQSLCEINSGSANLEGLDRICQALKQSWETLADKVEVRQMLPISLVDMKGNWSQQPCGNTLFIQKRPELKRRVILTGHMDTVYGVDSPFQKLTWLDENTINGPGVADMKGGLLVMFHALQAFENTPNAKEIGWDVLINADEELGSPASGDLFYELAPHYKAGLVYEPAMTPTGTLAKNRRGSGKLTLIAGGKSSHVGRAFDQGRNAICYLAEAIGAIHALNGLREGVTINVGKISGGDALNMVPDNAVAKLDVRINQPEDEFWIRQEMDKIIKAMQMPGYSLRLEGGFHRPVKRVNRSTEKLFDKIQKVAEQLGLNIEWKDSGGCCDGNNLAKNGLPVIDTLGVRGGAIHSPEEFILVDSLPERAALTALLMAELSQGGLEELEA